MVVRMIVRMSVSVGAADSSTYLEYRRIISIYRECKARWDASWTMVERNVDESICGFA
jgi:hypothetical protein